MRFFNCTLVMIAMSTNALASDDILVSGDTHSVALLGLDPAMKFAQSQSGMVPVSIHPPYEDGFVERALQQRFPKARLLASGPLENHAGTSPMNLNLSRGYLLAIPNDVNDSELEKQMSFVGYASHINVLKVDGKNIRAVPMELSYRLQGLNEAELTGAEWIPLETFNTPLTAEATIAFAQKIENRINRERTVVDAEFVGMKPVDRDKMMRRGDAHDVLASARVKNRAATLAQSPLAAPQSLSLGSSSSRVDTSSEFYRGDRTRAKSTHSVRTGRKARR